MITGHRTTSLVRPIVTPLEYSLKVTLHQVCSSENQEYTHAMRYGMNSICKGTIASVRLVIHQKTVFVMENLPSSLQNQNHKYNCSAMLKPASP